MKNRCVRDLFGYCNDSSKMEQQPIINELGFSYGGKCNLNPKSCNCFSTFQEELKQSKEGAFNDR